VRELLTLKQAAEWASVSELTVRRRIQAGELRAYKFGGQVRIKRVDLEQALRLVVVQP
jgi:excisionase family DNA binding protein